METYLAHHGILGMKWGVRRYQNEDGTLTPAGKKNVSDRSASTRHIGIVGHGAVNLVAKGHRAVAQIQKRSVNSIRKDAESIKSQKAEMLSIRKKSGAPLFTEKEIDDMVNSLLTEAGRIDAKSIRHDKFADQLIKELGEIKMRDLEFQKES